MHEMNGASSGNGLVSESDFQSSAQQVPGLFDSIDTSASAPYKLAGNNSFLAQILGSHAVYLKGQPILWGVDSDDFIASCILVFFALIAPFVAQKSAFSMRKSLRNSLDAGDDSVYKSVLVKLPETFFERVFFDGGLCLSFVILKVAVDILDLPVIAGIDTTILAVIVLKCAFFFVACDAIFKVVDACHQVLTERYAEPIGLVDIFNSVTSPLMLLFKTVLGLLVFVCVAGLLARTGDNMSSMFMSFISVCTLGAFGFLGLAVKGIAQEYQSAVDIITEGLFKKDDEIEIQSAGRNVRGRVIAVETRITRILTNDGVLVTIPNNSIPCSMVVNHSARKFTQVAVELIISQKCKIDDIRRFMDDVVATIARDHADTLCYKESDQTLVLPKAQFAGVLHPSGIPIYFVAFASATSSKEAVRSHLTGVVLSVLQQSNVKCSDGEAAVPFASLNLTPRFY